jgi:hypothetical protein
VGICLTDPSTCCIQWDSVCPTCGSLRVFVGWEFDRQCQHRDAALSKKQEPRGVSAVIAFACVSIGVALKSFKSIAAFLWPAIRSRDSERIFFVSRRSVSISAFPLRGGGLSSKDRPGAAWHPATFSRSAAEAARRTSRAVLATPRWRIELFPT